MRLIAERPPASCRPPACRSPVLRYSANSRPQPLFHTIAHPPESKSNSQQVPIPFARSEPEPPIISDASKPQQSNTTHIGRPGPDCYNVYDHRRSADSAVCYPQCISCKPISPHATEPRPAELARPTAQSPIRAISLRSPKTLQARHLPPVRAVSRDNRTVEATKRPCGAIATAIQVYDCVLHTTRKAALATCVNSDACSKYIYAPVDGGVA